MNICRHRFEELCLNKHSDLIEFAKQEPPIKYEFLWGRDAAKARNKLSNQIDNFWKQK